jgi:hypothetical protein
MDEFKKSPIDQTRPSFSMLSPTTDKLHAKLSFIEQQIQKERSKGLKTLRSTIASLTKEQIDQIHETNIHEQLFQILKDKRKDEEEIIQVLDCIQGLCLLSFPSKQWWGDVKLCVILTFLAARNESLLLTTLETIESVLVDCSMNLRRFEGHGGVNVVCALLKRKPSEMVMFKIIELLGVYLLEEESNPDYSEHGTPMDCKTEKVSKELGPSAVEAILEQIRMT